MNNGGVVSFEVKRFEHGNFVNKSTILRPSIAARAVSSQWGVAPELFSLSSVALAVWAMFLALGVGSCCRGLELMRDVAMVIISSVVVCHMTWKVLGLS